MAMTGRPVGKLRNPWFVIVISIITLGIYALYWQYQVFKDNKAYSGEGIGGPIGLVIAIIPVFVFFRTLFGQSPTMKKAVSEFQKQIDYLVWMILFLIAVGLIYSLVNLFHPLWG